MRRFFATMTCLYLTTACGSMDDSNSTMKADEASTPYLALGDSVVFGHTPHIELNNENVANNLFVGYPEVLGNRAALKAFNLACPGETSSSLVDQSIPDNGCHTDNDPSKKYLKVKYEISQLDFAKDFLAENPATELVTITIGGNDLLMVESECDATAAPFLCKIAKLPGAAITIAKNLNAIFDGLRSSGYQGEIVFVTQYATDYKDTIQKLALGTLQAEVRYIAGKKGIKVASGYDAFKNATASFDGDSCQAGLLIDMGEGRCDNHPSLKGHEVLAQTVLETIAE